MASVAATVQAPAARIVERGRPGMTAGEAGRARDIALRVGLPTRILLLNSSLPWAPTRACGWPGHARRPPLLHMSAAGRQILQPTPLTPREEPPTVGSRSPVRAPSGPGREWSLPAMVSSLRTSDDVDTASILWHTPRLKEGWHVMADVAAACVTPRDLHSATSHALVAQW